MEDTKSYLEEGQSSGTMEICGRNMDTEGRKSQDTEPVWDNIAFKYWK